MQKLEDAEIEQKLGSVPGWRLDGGELTRDFKFQDFSGAMQFANRIAEIAEGRNHHPDLCVSWGRVSASLVTHSAGGLTQADFDLARAIDELGAEKC
jgi:4a-hydroxytetrahydrobiopterin dehydratase